MNNIILTEKVRIEDMIYEVRGVQVMLDSDIAKLYQVETKRINEAVKNNLEKFPERFSWILTENEWIFLRPKISTLENNLPGKGHHRKYLPRVFTEQGVAMLATILKSKVATKVSINIMDAFVLMRKYISSSLIEQKYINNLVLEHEERLKIVENTFSNFKEKNNHLFFKGQIYDAYSLLLDIFEKSKNDIIIIDNYIDRNILDMLSKTKKEVKIVTNKYNNQDYEKYKMQYKNVELIINNKFHDRFIIIDKKILYHCGASFKDLGKQCFEISKIEDNDILDKLLKKL
ncbi:MAG: ORF6N domain-containing protein [Bacilli bacterium]|nr:ORF6N domain-containing protein [Bacilli bacterium]